MQGYLSDINYSDKPELQVKLKQINDRNSELIHKIRSMNEAVDTFEKDYIAENNIKKLYGLIQKKFPFEASRDYELRSDYILVNRYFYTCDAVRKMNEFYNQLVTRYTTTDPYRGNQSLKMLINAIDSESSTLEEKFTRLAQAVSEFERTYIAKTNVLYYYVTEKEIFKEYNLKAFQALIGEANEKITTDFIAKAKADINQLTEEVGTTEVWVKVKYEMNKGSLIYQNYLNYISKIQEGLAQLEGILKELEVGDNPPLLTTIIAKWAAYQPIYNTMIQNQCALNLSILNNTNVSERRQELQQFYGDTFVDFRETIPSIQKDKKLRLLIKLSKYSSQLQDDTTDFVTSDISILREKLDDFERPILKDDIKHLIEYINSIKTTGGLFKQVLAVYTHRLAAESATHNCNTLQAIKKNLVECIPLIEKICPLSHQVKKAELKLSSDDGINFKDDLKSYFEKLDDEITSKEVSNKGETDGKKAQSERHLIMNALRKYIDRVESKKDGQKTDFQHNFFMLWQQRGINRSINHEIAKKLLKTLEEKPELPIGFVFSRLNIDKIRSPLVEKNKTYPVDLGIYGELALIIQMVRNHDVRKDAPDNDFPQIFGVR